MTTGREHLLHGFLARVDGRNDLVAVDLMGHPGRDVADHIGDVFLPHTRRAEERHRRVPQLVRVPFPQPGVCRDAVEGAHEP